MRLDERGKQCPLPVIEAKKALEASAPGEKVEVERFKRGSSFEIGVTYNL